MRYDVSLKTKIICTEENRNKLDFKIDMVRGLFQYHLIDNNTILLSLASFSPK